VRIVSLINPSIAKYPEKMEVNIPLAIAAYTLDKCCCVL
jgi:hypothetical protein